MSHGFKFKEKVDEPPQGHIELVNITTDGGLNLCVNFNRFAMEPCDDRHLQIMVDALKDAFYRLKPHLRKN